MSNEPAILVEKLSKTYQNGFHALDGVDMQVNKGEIFALLGPNGAGKTTLISIICGLVTPSSGSVKVQGFDNQKDYRKARALIGLVPQELTTDAFETPLNCMRFSRGLFGKAANQAKMEQILTDLSLYDKRNQQIRMLSGGMKRRVLIAKALSHEPEILFLDEPTAGVDVELRKSMWQQVQRLREQGVTIILTTHYLEEAEEMADRIAVINQGKVMITEEKNQLIQKMGKKQLWIELDEAINELPSCLSGFDLTLDRDANKLVYEYDANTEQNSIFAVLDAVRQANIACKDIHTKQSSLEDIFVDLVGKK